MEASQYPLTNEVHKTFDIMCGKPVIYDMNTTSVSIMWDRIVNQQPTGQYDVVESDRNHLHASCFYQQNY